MRRTHLKISHFETGSTLSTFWAVASASIGFCLQAPGPTKIGYSLAVKPHSGLSTEIALICKDGFTSWKIMLIMNRAVS